MLRNRKDILEAIREHQHQQGRRRLSPKKARKMSTAQLRIMLYAIEQEALWFCDMP